MSDNPRFTGKTHSEETRTKLSEHNKGKQLSEETKKKISETKTGTKPSEESRKKMSESHKGHRHSDETKAKISETMKAKSPPKPIRYCELCGKEITSKHGTRFCSKSCSSKSRPHIYEPKSVESNAKRSAALKDIPQPLERYKHRIGVPRTDETKARMKVGLANKHHALAPWVDDAYDLRRTRIKAIFNAMKQRCYSEKCNTFKYYGGKGVKVCDKWLKNWHNFYHDMHDTWFEGASIDRLDSDGDYVPENCRWITRGQNISRAFKGKSPSAETRKNMSIAAKRRWAKAND